jgi:outer membrane immunogenic protein
MVFKFQFPAAVLARGALGPLHAAAAEPATGPFYAGASYGFRASSGLDCVPAQGDCDKSSKRNGKAYLGYSFDALPFQGGVALPSVELVGYMGGEVKSGFDTGAGKVAGRGKFTGLGMQGVLAYQFDAFSLSGRAGAAYTQGKVDYLSGGWGTKGQFGVFWGGGGAAGVLKAWGRGLGWGVGAPREGGAAP